MLPGLRLVKGSSVEGADNATIAHVMPPFTTLDDIAERANLSTQDLQALAKVNALVELAGHRRQMAWDVADMRPMSELLRDAPIPDVSLELRVPTDGKGIVGDYHNTGLTLRHPLALLRKHLIAMNLNTAEELQTLQDRKRARSDETGTTQVIVWQSLVEQQRKEMLNATLLTVYGVWQHDGASMHLIAKRLVEHTSVLRALNSIKSRNFH